MFRKMTTTLAMAALVACSACNNVTGPAASDENLTNLNRVELGDPGDGSGGGRDIAPVQSGGSGRIRNGQHTPNRVELGDPGDGSGSGADARIVEPPGRPGHQPEDRRVQH